MAALLTGLQALLGSDNVVAGAEVSAAVYSPWTRLGEPVALVRPRSTAEVAGVVRLAREFSTPVVPWGGRTGLVDGALADGAIALSFERMAAVEAIDPAASTLTVQAGCVLETACRAVEAEGLFLPLDLGARGSATLGGMIATNAGGNRVLRYGMTRDSVLGLEVVLADGTVISSLNTLIKNNAGYDLKQLFIGSEGTLGIVTRAVLRLRPKPVSQQTALVGVDRFEALAPLLRLLEGELAGGLSAFEAMWPEFYELVTTPPAAGRPVLPPAFAFYVLVESLGADPELDGDRFNRVLNRALEDGLIADAVIAKSQAECDRLWALRDDVAQTARNGPILTFDVGLPIARMDGYVADVRATLARALPKATLTVFGHLGDGNLHLIVGADPAAKAQVEAAVYRPLASLNGTVSAEHGIGLQKRAYLHLSRSAEEIALMRQLKAALDPGNLLNPGKILSGPGSADVNQAAT
ncbi:MAG: FAD-binding oxidoreductase [Caulobacter sp.]|nr:FAD-binding oxidoreductase [Caulobacter sp.]